jgi:flagellar hook-length control protein FliK
MIGQREITLALPFAAKSGDSLELEVIDNDGKLALAVANRNAQNGNAPSAENGSVATRLTATGRLIGDLLAGVDKENGKRPQPAPLNNAAPVLSGPPEDTAATAAALKTALVRSGMFYEAHQARWVEGQLPTAALFAEPQGQLSPAAQLTQLAQGAGQPLAQPHDPAAAANRPDAAGPATSTTAQPAAASAHIAPTGNPPGAALSSAATEAAGGAHGVAPDHVVRVGMGQVVAPQLAPLVQQQLEALASHVYVWQGQIWPGQNMEWEIVDENAERPADAAAASATWTTYLRLSLPQLGGIDACLRLIDGKAVDVQLRVDNETARQKLSAANPELQQQFARAGLALTGFIARHVEPQPEST